jgi:hypothetical protein
MFDLASLDSETLSILKSNGFDSIPFSGFVERIKDRPHREIRMESVSRPSATPQ